MTGRNHTTNGMATITDAASGFPSSNGHIPFECATIAEVLGERGWNTYMTGKWHLTAEDEMNMASRKTQWPVGRGFERFYGFLGAETNQWYPDLVYDNHPVEPPKSPEEGYHLTEDLTDKALEFIQDAQAVAPDERPGRGARPGRQRQPRHHQLAEQLGQLAGGLAARNVPIGLAHVHGPALEMAERSGLLATVGADHVFPTTPAAVAWAQSVADAPTPR